MQSLAPAGPFEEVVNLVLDMLRPVAGIPEIAFDML